MTKGTPSQGRRSGKKSHINCRRCGSHSYHIRKKKCSSCGYGGASKKAGTAKLRKYTWNKK